MIHPSLLVPSPPGGQADWSPTVRVIRTRERRRVAACDLRWVQPCRCGRLWRWRDVLFEGPFGPWSRTERVAEPSSERAVGFHSSLSRGHPPPFSMRGARARRSTALSHSLLRFDDQMSSTVLLITVFRALLTKWAFFAVGHHDEALSLNPKLHQVIAD